MPLRREARAGRSVSTVYLMGQTFAATGQPNSVLRYPIITSTYSIRDFSSKRVLICHSKSMRATYRNISHIHLIQCAVRRKICSRSPGRESGSQHHRNTRPSINVVRKRNNNQIRERQKIGSAPFERVHSPAWLAIR